MFRSLLRRRDRRSPLAHDAPAGSVLFDALEPRVLLNTAPVVRISVADPSAAEFPRDIGEFIIRRTGDIEQPLTIRYLISGRAQSGVDFTPLDAQVTIPAGRRSTTLPIIPIDDLDVEGDEEVVVTLLDDAAYDLDSTGRNRSAALTIRDDDTVPVVTIRAPDPLAQEAGQTTAKFVIHRTGALELPLTVNLRIAGSATPGVDYQTLPSTVTIRAGRNRVVLFVRPINDSEFEGNETVRITLQPDPDRFTLSQTNPRLVTNWAVIRDRPVVNLTIADPTATSHPSDTASFLIWRSGPVNQPLRIDYSLGGTANPGTDYVRPANLITIPRGQSFVLVTIRGRDTQFDVPFRTVRMTLDPLDTYNIDLSNRESYSRYIRIWDDTQGPPYFIDSQP